MDRLIINCDLGENESTEQTAQLMASVDAANICCGVHAGGREKTREALLLAKQQGVVVGAHPGLPGAGGRGYELLGVDAFRELLKAQLGSFLDLAAEIGVAVAYVKLHGSLYSAVETDAGLLQVYLDVLRALNPERGLFARSGGQCASAARESGLRVWEEVFADRGYLEIGALVPRGSVGAVLEFREATRRFEHWYGSGNMASVNGSEISLSADTICVHSDSPDALQLIQAIRLAIDSATL